MDSCLRAWTGSEDTDYTPNNPSLFFNVDTDQDLGFSHLAPSVTKSFGDEFLFDTGPSDFHDSVSEIGQLERREATSLTHTSTHNTTTTKDPPIFTITPLVDILHDSCQVEPDSTTIDLTHHKKDESHSNPLYFLSNQDHTKSSDTYDVIELGEELTNTHQDSSQNQHSLTSLNPVSSTVHSVHHGVLQENNSVLQESSSVLTDQLHQDLRTTTSSVLTDQLHTDLSTNTDLFQSFSFPELEMQEEQDPVSAYYSSHQDHAFSSYQRDGQTTDGHDLLLPLKPPMPGLLSPGLPNGLCNQTAGPTITWPEDHNQQLGQGPGGMYTGYSDQPVSWSCSPFSRNPAAIQGFPSMSVNLLMNGSSCGSSGSSAEFEPWQYEYTSVQDGEPPLPAGRTFALFDSPARFRRSFRSPAEYYDDDKQGLLPLLEDDQGVSLPSSPDSSSDGKNVCRICGKGYARPSTLKTHLRTHSGERPYRCLQCNKSFSQAANLTAHCRTHSGEKPFHCTICNRKFSQSSSVTTHMRTHSGDRPYRCRMCKKAFSDSSTLTKHLRIHSGEKPYQCRLCSLRFSQSGNLNRHMRIHAQNGMP